MLQLCVCRDIEYLGSLESTQEVRVAQGANHTALSCSSNFPHTHADAWTIPRSIWHTPRSICNISSMRPLVSSPDETLRRELKLRRAAEYFFWRTSRCFIWWWNTVSNAWYYFSNKLILEGEIKDTKLRSFSSDFQTLIKHWFPLYFLYELLISLRKLIQ